jgi:hypothetical protein
MISHRSKGFVYPEYISPLPAEEFIKGALLKQKMFDEGVDKVQQQLDAYGQIRKTLLKPEDKAYFDQEATKLVNALNKNAGLDFANKNNLRSALSLGRNLINDPIISNAAESTATYTKMMEEYNKLDPKYKSPVNDYFFQKEINGWLKDGKYGSKLKYNPYTVYTDEHVKLWKELSSSLKPDETEVPVFDSKNNQWIMQKKYSGVTAERFREAYLNGLSGQAKAQLDMDARYALETGDKDNIINKYNQDLNTKLTAISLELNQNLTKQAQIERQYGKTSPEYLKAQQAIRSLTTAQTFYQEKQQKGPQDPDLISYLRDDKIFDASGAFAYKAESTKLEANPYVLDYARMQNNIAEARAKANIDIAKEAELVRRGLKDGATDVPLAAGAYKPDAKYNTSPEIGRMSSIYGSIESTTEGQQIQLAMHRLSKNKTIKEVLERVANKNTWDPNERRIINESFLPSDPTGITAEGQQKLIKRGQELTNNVFRTWQDFYNKFINQDPVKVAKDSARILKDNDVISIKEITGGVRDMTLSTFLSKSGDYLAKIEEIRLPKTL